MTSPIYEYAAQLWRDMRDEFELSVEAAHAKAEEGTGGAMLNKRGRAEGIDAYSLMTGPWRRVLRYGAPELIEWCEEHGRPSLARFEREWFTSWMGETPEPPAVTELQAQLDGIREAYQVLAPGTRVQFNLEAPEDWAWKASWPGLAFGHVIGVETTNGLDPIYQVQLDAARGRDGIHLLRPASFVVVS